MGDKLDNTEKQHLVCAMCGKHLNDKTRVSIPTPSEHYAYGLAATITVCKKCLLRKGPATFRKLNGELYGNKLLEK